MRGFSSLNFHEGGGVVRAANDFVDVIRDIYQQEFAKKDQTILCQIKARVDDTHYDLTIVPD